MDTCRKIWPTALALALAAFVAMLLAMVPASLPVRAAGPWYVAPGGSDGNDCLSYGPTYACATINGALGKPGFEAGDTILVATGTYTGTGDQVVLLDKDATLSGGWNANFTAQSGASTIDGEGARRGITVNSGVTAVVEHYAVQNGSSDFGGGIYNYDGTATLNNSTVSGNMATGWLGSGGIYNQYGALTLNNSAISGNAASNAYGSGGIYNNGIVTLNNSTVSSNVGEFYGGIFNDGGSVVLNNSTVSSNTGDSFGGGIFNRGTVTLNNSTISNNSANDSGGGIGNSYGTVTLNNSTVSGNTARRGGGIYNYGTLTLNSSTISNNSARDEGGGIWNGVTVTLQNSILDGNLAGTSPDCLGTIGSSGYNLLGNTSGCAFTLGTGDLTNVSAHLGPLIGAPGAPRYHPLFADSPAIDAANPAGCTGSSGPLSTDQRGASRVGRCDIGAYEYTTPGPAASIYVFGGTLQHTPPLRIFEYPLQALVLDSIGSPVDSTIVTFTAPANGASGTFTDSGTFTTTAVTNEGGVATAATLTANGLTGSYAVTATVSGVVTAANFLLHNIWWYVAPGGDDGNDCLSAATACATINSALGKADFAVGDTVLVATGIYTGTGTEVVLLNKNATLSGGWDAGFTAQSGTSTIDGQEARRGITVSGGVTAIVERFAVQNGSCDGPSSDGGSIRNSGGTVTINNSIIGGSSGGGFGIWSSGAITLNNCIVSGNADSGGINNSGTMTLNNCIVSGNLGGGGIWNSGTMILNSSTVDGNSNPYGLGGGIGNGGKLILNNSTVSGNSTSRRGGGIYTWTPGTTSTLTLNNSTISGNRAGDGGGIYNYDSHGSVTLSSSTVSNNTAGASGGGIDGYGTATLRNTILTGNTASSGASDCSWNTVVSAGYNLIGNTSSCAFTPDIGDLTNIDAKLGPLEGSPGYHPLLPGSPAIDAGNPAGCMGSTGLLITDQRGATRIGRCDIGAYETGLTAAKQASGTYVPGSALAYSITLDNAASAAITGVRITDTLPISLTYVPGSFSANTGTGGESGGVITWTGIVPAGGNTAISFRATIGENVPSCSVITNKATIGSQSYEFERQVTGATPCACNLTKHAGNPALSVGPSGTWDDDVWSPVVLKEGGGYKMWYTGDDGSNPSRIGLATSTDGITWTKSISNPVLSPGPSWEAGGIRAGSVISDGGLYKMWYTGFDSNGVGRIGYATSPDGVAWTEYGSNPVLGVGASGSWEDDDVLDPTVIKEGSTYHMWYSGYDGITNRIGHATSSDGTTWTKDPANPVLDVGSPGGWDWLHVYGPSVIRYNDTFLMWYSGETLPEARQTGYALSSDGSAWTRRGMLIPEGASGAFDADSADYPSALADGDQFKVWYSGLNASGTYNIGYATAEVCAAAAPPNNPVHLPIVFKGGGAGPTCPAYYTDDFSDPGSGWAIDEDSVCRYAYTGGQYQIWVKDISYLISTTPGAQATDFTVAVSARRASGSRGGYGIVFGINEGWSERYQFLIDANTYSIWKRSGGSWTPLRGWTASSYIKTGTNWNRLKVIRSGASIAVYVNDHYLVTVTDGSYTGLRRIGLVASPSGSPLDARFDDFALYPAECGVSAASVGFEMGKPETHEEPAAPGLDRAP
jgi:uncharacterized repeat protein (TIGR01451 family)